MTRRKKELRDYPSAFWDVLQAMKAGEPIVQLAVNDRGAAFSVAHDWNRFKQSLNRAAGEPEQQGNVELQFNMEFAQDIMARPQQRGADAATPWIVEFTPRGLFNLARQLKGHAMLDHRGKPIGPDKDADGLPDFPPPMEDDQDAKFRKLMGLGDSLPGDVKKKEDKP